MLSVHIPPWALKGCKIIKVWDELVRSGTARGTRTRVCFLDKKGNEKQLTKWVKWDVRK